MVPFLVLLKKNIYLCSMEKILYIVRGIPGSGKSTFAKTLGGIHIEADQYFVDGDGNYNFDGSKKHNEDLELKYPDLSKFKIWR